MDPRFTTGTCTTLLSAVGVWVDSKSILIAEIFDFDSEGTASRTMSLNVSDKNDIDRLAIQPHVTGTMGGKRAGSHCRFLSCHLDYPIDAQVRSPFPLIPRIEGFSAGQPPMSMVGALCCTTRSHKQRRQDRFCPPLPTPGVTICASCLLVFSLCCIHSVSSSRYP